MTSLQGNFIFNHCLKQIILELESKIVWASSWTPDSILQKNALFLDFSLFAVVR